MAGPACSEHDGELVVPEVEISCWTKAANADKHPWRPRERDVMICYDADDARLIALAERLEMEACPKVSTHHTFILMLASMRARL